MLANFSSNVISMRWFMPIQNPSASCENLQDFQQLPYAYSNIWQTGLFLNIISSFPTTIITATADRTSLKEMVYATYVIKWQCLLHTWPFINTVCKDRCKLSVWLNALINGLKCDNARKWSQCTARPGAGQIMHCYLFQLALGTKEINQLLNMLLICLQSINKTSRWGAGTDTRDSLSGRPAMIFTSLHCQANWCAGMKHTISTGISLYSWNNESWAIALTSCLTYIIFKALASILPTRPSAGMHANTLSTRTRTRT